MKYLQRDLEEWAIQSFECTPLYDGEIGARNVIVGWQCTIVNKDWYKSGIHTDIVDAIQEATEKMSRKEATRW